MKIRIVPALLGGLSLLSSTSVFAHTKPSASGSLENLVHLLTGTHHAPALILVVFGVVYLVRKIVERTNRFHS